MEVKGTAVIAIRDYVKKEHSSDYSRWLEVLSPEARNIYESAIDSTKWYPVEGGAKEPTEKIAKLFFNGNVIEGAKESGRYSADKALTGIYKIFVKAANPQYIIKRASRVFATYYRPVEINVVRVPEKGVILEISKVTNRYEAIEQRIIGWCCRALEISGCEDVKITNKHIRDDGDGKVIELDMSWN
jgi:hypothetical protein